MSYIQQFFTSRDNNANAETFVGQEGRLWWDPVSNQIYSSDGNTPGGIPLSGGGGGNGSPGGSNSQVQFNQAGNFGGSANLTFNSVTGALTAVSFTGNGAALTSITGANVTGTVADATHANTADLANAVAGGNVTGNVSNAVHAYFADVANSVAGSNVSGAVANATYATSAGTATSATTAGTVTTNAQPNITSVGTLTSVTSSGNISTTGNVSGNYYIGNGSLLTGITSSYGNANVVANLAALGTNPVSTTGNVTAAYLIGNGSLLTSLTGGNVTGTVANATYATSAGTAGTVTTNAQPNITSVGTLTSITSSGNISTTGNVTAGNVIATNITTTSGNLYGNNGTYNNPNFITPFIGDADWAYGLYSNGSVVFTQTKFWGGGDTAHGYRVYDTFGAGNTRFSVDGTGNTNLQNISSTGFISAAGNITGNYYIGNGSQLTGITSSYGNANVVANLAALGSNPVSTTGNVNSGNLITSGLVSATGNVIAGNLNAAGLSLSGNVVSALTSAANITTTANVSGGNILTSGVLSATANVTGGNLLTGGLISVTGNITSAANISGGNILGGANVNATTHTGTTVSVTANVTGGNLLTGGVASATGNITGGNLTTGGLAAVTGNITGGNLLTAGLVSATGNIIGANANVNGLINITYAPATTTGASMQVTAANTQGGTGYADFLKATNTTTGATNANKWFRIGSTGTMEIINSAYTGSLFSLTDAGALSTGQLQINGKKAVNGPAFRAWANSNQTITSGSQQKVTFTVESFDTDNCFANSTFTPTTEGYYQFNSTVRISGNSGTGEVMIILYKNGSEYARGTNESGTEQGASFYSMQVSDIAYANGTTDNFEVWIQQTSTANRTVTSAATISYFSGCMIRGA